MGKSHVKISAMNTKEPPYNLLVLLIVKEYYWICLYGQPPVNSNHHYYRQSLIELCSSCSSSFDPLVMMLPLHSWAM